MKDELATWQVAFRRCADSARAAGRRAAADINFDGLEDDEELPLEPFALSAAVGADHFVDGFERKLVAARIWDFTRHLVVEPLLPAARRSIRDEYRRGYFESVALDVIEKAGHA